MKSVLQKSIRSGETIRTNVLNSLTEFPNARDEIVDNINIKQTFLNKKIFSLILAFAFFMAMAVKAQTPFDPAGGVAYTVRNSPAELFVIDQSASPSFTFTQIGGPYSLDVTPLDGSNNPIPVQLNNLGFRSTDGLLYAMVLDDLTGAAATQGNYGIVKIDAAGTIFPVAIPAPSPIPGLGSSTYRLPAGDITPDGSTMFINAQVTSNVTDANRRLYVVDLTASPVTATHVDKSFPGTTVNVADWAIGPDGRLYGASAVNGLIYQLNPSTGDMIIVPGSGSGGSYGGLPTGTASTLAYGGAWFNSDGRFFAYRNNGQIYEIDLDFDAGATNGLGGSPTLISRQTGGPVSSYNDATASLGDGGGAPLIVVEKTVTTETGTAPGSEELTITSGETVKYLYVVKNTADLGILYDVTLVDDNGTPDNPGDDFTITITSGLTDEDIDGNADDLAAGATATGEATVTISNSGTVINTATGSGTDAGGLERTDSDIATVIAEELPPPSFAPFDCGINAFLIQNQNSSSLYEVDQMAAPFAVNQIDGPLTNYEINNLGFREADGLLYGWKRTSNYTTNQGPIVSIDANGVITELGLNGLPSSFSTGGVTNGVERSFISGDVAPDGSAMYFNYAGVFKIWTVKFAGPQTFETATSQDIKLIENNGVVLANPILGTRVGSTFNIGRASDWAAHPDNGLLYGGDDTHGQIAILNPVNGERRDFALSGLPGGLLGFGAAWFNSVGRLFLYENSGIIFEVDLGGDPTNPTPTIISTQAGGPASQFNDGASCVSGASVSSPLISVEKTVTTSSGSLPGVEELAINQGETVKYLYVVKNNATTGTLFDVSLTDDNGTPGDTGDDFLITIISGLTDVDSDGNADDLAAGATANGEALVTITGSGTIVNTVTASGTDAGGLERTDSDIATVIAEELPPFECSVNPFIVYDFASQLNQMVLSTGTSSFTFNNIASPINDLQINNLGYRNTDNLLYGWERNAADDAGQIVKITSTGDVIGLGNPGLPATQGTPKTVYNYNAGDVSVDGTKFYLSYSNSNGAGGTLYIVDLPALTLTTKTISGASGSVADWAVNPLDGKLYGGDQTEWELAILDPADGSRTDVNIGLPNEGSLGYGAAWFDETGRLFLYHNSGKIYAVDNVDTTPILVGGSYPLVNAALATNNNDGASCAIATVEVADLKLTKTVDNPTAPIGSTVTFTIAVTNEGPNATTATNVSIGDVIPDGFAYVAASIAGGDSRSDASAPTLSWEINSLAKDATVDLTFQATVKASGDYTNVAQVIASDQSDPDSTPNNEDGDPYEDDEDDAVVTPNQSGSLSGQLYSDTNGNGRQDAGEPNLANVDVIVTDIEGTVVTVSTDANGEWTATGLAPGDATADVDENDPDYPAGTTQTEGDDPTTATVVAGSDEDGGTDGYFQIIVSITSDKDCSKGAEGLPSGIITVTGSGYATLQLWSAGVDGEIGGEDDSQIGSDVTTSVSPYLFEDVYSGSYYVIALPPISAEVAGAFNETSNVAMVEECYWFNILKLTQGIVDPTRDWLFKIYEGADGYGNTGVASAGTFGDTDGILDFSNLNLDPDQTYTICEENMAAGWSAIWVTDINGTENVLMTYNPNADDNPSQDLGTRCFDIGAGTAYPLYPDDVFTIKVDNTYPGGTARTPGYWKNWNTCSDGGQFANAEKQGGWQNGYWLLDDVLNAPGVTLGTYIVENCEIGVNILDQRDLTTLIKRASDAAYTLAMHLMAFKLNQAAGAYECQYAIDAAMNADVLLAELKYNGAGKYLSSRAKDYAYALSLAKILDSYNNNLLDETDCGATTAEPPVSISDLTCSTDVISDATSFKGSDGVVEIIAENGNGALMYSIGTGPFVSTNTFDGLTAGNYTFTVKDAEGNTCSCYATITQPRKTNKSAEIVTAIEPVVEFADLKVYPNPFSDRLRFKFVSPESVDARIDLYDMTGRFVETIFEQSVESGVSYEAEFRPEQIISAMYIYRISLGENVTNGRVIFKKE